MEKERACLETVRACAASRWMVRICSNLFDFFSSLPRGLKCPEAPPPSSRDPADTCGQSCLGQEKKRREQGRRN